jgi:tetratricopeptide (TPR) repeat protein
LLRVLTGIAVLAGVTFLAAVWWPNAQDGRVPPSRPEESPAVGTAEGGAPPPVRPKPPAVRPPGEGGAPTFAEAMAWDDVGQPARSIEYLDQILVREPENAEALFLRGNAYLKIAMPRLAERDFRAAVEREPTAERLEALADVIKMRLPDEAIECLRKAAEIAPERARTHSLMARIHYRLGRLEEARAETEEALELDPTDELALRMQDQLR